MKCIEAYKWLEWIPFGWLFIDHCWHYDPVKVTEIHGQHYTSEPISYNSASYKCCYCGKVAKRI